MTSLLQFLKIFACIVLGLSIGGLVNYGLIILTSTFVPEGVDPSNVESIKRNIHRYTPFHFLFPFLAHAIGTFVGAFVAQRLSKSTHKFPAYTVGFFFLIGGITMILQLPSPAWFTVIDLGLAYIPMAWLAAKLAK